MTDTIERIDFVAITDWTNSVKHLTADQARVLSANEITALRLPHDLPPHSIIGSDIEIYRDRDTCGGRAVFKFAIPGKGKVPAQTCYALPVHFAIMRILEKAPGVGFKMVSETDRQDRQAGRVRSDSERIFRLNLEIGARPAIGVEEFAQGVTRTLFNAPTDARLNERRNGSHHHITPEEHVLTKRNSLKKPPGQGTVLDAVRRIVEAASDGSLPFTAVEISELLTTLYTIGDVWHWDALDGRLDKDERRVFFV